VTATVNGIVYAIGGAVAGEAVRTVEAYDPATQTWSNHPNLPVPSKSGVSAAIGGKLYVYTPEGAVYQGTAHLHRYDPGSNTWTELAIPPIGHGRACSRPRSRSASYSSPRTPHQP
jgi:N-acetylneuraminic acid mutarotase